MHQGRQRIAGRLDRLRARRHEEQARVGEHRVARDRTAWPLHERAALLDATDAGGDRGDEVPQAVDSSGPWVGSGR